jgi:hypothetical protein
VETRISSLQFRRAPWASEEPSVALLRLSLSVAPRVIDVDLVNLGAFSLHARSPAPARIRVTDEAAHIGIARKELCRRATCAALARRLHLRPIAKKALQSGRRALSSYVPDETID